MNNANQKEFPITLTNNLSSEIHIIGQGLAGTVIAFLLLEKGYAVTVVDDGHVSSSSKIAAGMWNPISFKRMIASWSAQLFLPTMHSVFTRMENVLGEKFFHPVELVRIFPDQSAANLWDEKSVSPNLSSYLTDKQDEQISALCHQPFGHGIVAESGWLDVQKMLIAAKVFFQFKNILVEKRFDFSDENLRNPESSKSLAIFCTGSVNRENPFFNHLPLIPNKGQLLTIKNTDLELKRMINFGKFLVPIGQGKFRIGSTYEFDHPNPLPTEEARIEMADDAQKLLSENIEVLDHVAGYRPTTIDRRPLLGFHPEFPNVAIFNGFGSKGVLLIPWCAVHFIEYLEGKTALNHEMNIARFNKM